jgi:ABC-type bacteriocin/lantibiotic exporter with double-glycine peptidase domain
VTDASVPITSPHLVSPGRASPAAVSTVVGQEEQTAAQRSACSKSSYGPSPEFAGGGPFHSRVIRMLLAERRALTWLFLSALLQMLLGLVSPWLSARAIDTALPDQAPHMLAIIALMVVVTTLHTSVAEWVHGKVASVLSAQVDVICAREVLRRFLMTRFAVIENQSFGQTNETLGATRTAAQAILDVVLHSGTLSIASLGVAIALWLWFPELAIAGLLMCLVMAAGASVFALREAALACACLDASSKAHNWLNVLLLSLPTLRASGAAPRAMRHWKQLVHAAAKVGLDRMYVQVAQGVVLQALPQLLAWGANAWLIWKIMNGSATLGQMTLANMLLGTLTSNVVSIVLTVVGFLAMRPHFERINALLDAADQTPERSPATEYSLPRAPEHAVELSDVWFRYSGESPWVLAGHSQTFPVGRVSTLRAASGAGKTTLLRLAAGLLEPQRGTVRVLGVDPSRTSHLVSYLPQQAALLEASIVTNLVVLSGTSIEVALAVAQHTGLARLLKQLPMGADTLVSVRGGNLSAGQCQLVLLTAAFASGRPVILLDEATSQIDQGTRSQIDWAALTRGKSVIDVTHE